MLEDLIHIQVNDSDYTLCGYGTDDIGGNDLQERQEYIIEFKQNKLEYGSNCKQCIKYLRRLKNIKY